MLFNGFYCIKDFFKYFFVNIIIFRNMRNRYYIAAKRVADYRYNFWCKANYANFILWFIATIITLYYKFMLISFKFFTYILALISLPTAIKRWIPLAEHASCPVLIIIIPNHALKNDTRWKGFGLKLKYYKRIFVGFHSKKNLKYSNILILPPSSAFLKAISNPPRTWAALNKIKMQDPNIRLAWRTSVQITPLKPPCITIKNYLG